MWQIDNKEIIFTLIYSYSKEEKEEEEEDEEDALFGIDNLYVAVGNYEPKFDNEISLSGGMYVQPINLKQNQVNFLKIQWKV